MDDNEEGLRLFRLFQAYVFGEHTEPPDCDVQCEVDSSGPQPIGTWLPQSVDGETVFLRRDLPDSIFWESSRERIQQNRAQGTNRICLIGESVAHGQFFTPAQTPAKALNRLVSEVDNRPWETIDLTRSCMNSALLIATCEASLQLDPDYVVLFAGNNWFADILPREDCACPRRRAFTAALSSEGARGLGRLFRESLEDHTRDVIRDLDAMARNSNAQFVFLIPASNYADWERLTPQHWLAGGDTAQWYELYLAGVEKLGAGMHEEALSVGEQMLELDGGTSPASNRLVAKCLMALGRDEEAYPYCVAESDYALMHDQFTSFPATPSFVRRCILSLASEVDLEVIDLESRFREYAGTPLLGSSLFVDYCHLNPTGFDVAMEPVASYISQREPVGDVVRVNSPPERAESASDSTARFRLAFSYFVVATYNLHFNRSLSDDGNAERSSGMLQHAVDLSDQILDLMEDYVKAKSCGFGDAFPLSQAGQRFSKCANSPLDLPISRSWPGSEFEAIASICGVLDTNGRPGDKLLEEFHARSIHLVNSVGIDLTAPKHVEGVNSSIKVAIDPEIATRRRLPFFKAWWPTSVFSLSVDATRNLVFSITLRSKSASNAAADVKVFVNEELCGQLPLAGTWRTHEISVAREHLVAGANSVRIKWPRLDYDASKESAEFVKRYSLGLPTSLFPVFGEVFSLRVKAEAASTDDCS